MKSRAQILEAIAANKPAGIPLPILDFSQIDQPGDLLEKFTANLKGVGGQVILVNGDIELQQLLRNDKSSGKFIINQVAEGGELDIVPADPALLESVFRAYIKGDFGVAENGAIWVLESAMGNRVLPFICEQLVLVLYKSELLANMHEAYAAIQINREGYGVFIAGPSKTADIEQSLVIGAHGPKALSVLIIM
jgi:L-lactate dehydrogenase complex protein LldG